MGNLSLPLALAGGTVLGVEGSQESVRWAQYNARQAGLRTRFIAADVPAYLRQMVKAQQRADIILLDPPRAGIGPAAALLPALRADQLLHVSCDPVTLARDLALLGSKGFSLTALTPLDMFPQTSHIEAAARLSSR
jgi:23S rRNA (uracil1939-C5)-methyltransferase